MANGTRAAAREYAAALAHAQKTRAGYVASVENLRGELELIGEADFDGLLRQAVATLKTCENNPSEHVSMKLPLVCRLRYEAAVRDRPMSSRSAARLLP